jgi:hypothetical protein
MVTEPQANKITIPVIRNLQVKTRFDDDGVSVTTLSFVVGTQPDNIRKLLEWMKSGAVQVEFMCPQLTFGMGAKP